MIKYTQTLLALFLIMVFSEQSSAQQDSVCNTQGSCCCSKNTPAPPAGVMISHLHHKGEWMISYKLMNMAMQGLMQGTQNISKADVFVNYLMSPTKMQMNMHMLMAMYGVSNRLTLMSMMNYNTTAMQMDMFTTDGHHHGGAASMKPMNTAGLSDVKLYALYGILNQGSHQVLASMGISFPTGSVQMKGDANMMMYNNNRLPYAMQLGSGTFDVMPCLNYLYTKNKLTGSSQVAAIIRTQKNEVGYKLGNEYSFNNWIAYQWLSVLSSSLRFEATTLEKISGQDNTLYFYNEPSANPANYGGTKLTGYVGSAFKFPGSCGEFLEKTNIGIEYGLPLYQNWNGIQMTNTQNINLSLSVSF